MPVFANGNILFHEDIARCLEETGADGVMSAEGQLYNPALFASTSSTSASSSSSSTPPPIDQMYPRHADLALEYLNIVQSIKTQTAISAVKGHLFKLMRPALGREKDLRDRMGKIKLQKDVELSFASGALAPYIQVCEEMKERMDVRSFLFPLFV